MALGFSSKVFGGAGKDGYSCGSCVSEPDQGCQEWCVGNGEGQDWVVNSSVVVVGVGACRAWEATV